MVVALGMARVQAGLSRAREAVVRPDWAAVRRRRLSAPIPKLPEGMGAFTSTVRRSAAQRAPSIQSSETGLGLMAR